jgi:putative FmdB family regulatory protein
MPSYDYKCLTCNKKVVLTFKTYADYDHAPKVCPRCQGTNLRRIIGKVAVIKSEFSRFSSTSLEDESTLEDLATADPVTLGRFMRRLGDETGTDLGEEFNTVVERLQRGEDPESIEASLAVPDDEGSGFVGSADEVMGEVGGEEAGAEAEGFASAAASDTE